MVAYVDAPLLRDGVELVDTPGTGSVFDHNTVEARAALDTVDAAIFVLSADPPMSASERGLLRTVHERSVALFVVLNKIDRLDSREIAAALRFTADGAAQALGSTALAETIRQLIRALDARYAEAVGGLAAVLSAAQALGDATASDAATRRAELTRHIDLLHDLTHRLTILSHGEAEPMSRDPAPSVGHCRRWPAPRLERRSLRAPDFGSGRAGEAGTGW